MPNVNGISRAQVMLPNRDDNHAKCLSVKGARVGVGWMPVVRPVRSKLYHQTVQGMSGKVARLNLDNCVSM